MHVHTRTYMYMRTTYVHVVATYVMYSVYTCRFICTCSPFAWVFKGATRAIYLIHALCHVTTGNIDIMWPQGNINISLWSRDKGAARIQLDSKYTTKVTVGVQDSYTMIVKAVSGLKAWHTTVARVQFDSNHTTRGRIELHRIAIPW